MYFIVKMKARLAIFEVRLQGPAREDDELLPAQFSRKQTTYQIVDDMIMTIKSVYQC